MKHRFSVEVDKYNPVALAYCLNRLQEEIPYFEIDWGIKINAGGIDYGTYMNIDIANMEIELSNQPDGDGDDMLDDVINAVMEEYDEGE